MKSNRRWMNWVLEMTATETVDLPFMRGARRAAFIARRTAPTLRTPTLRARA